LFKTASIQYAGGKRRDLRINQFFDDFANGTIIAFYRPTRIRTSIWQVNSDGHLKEQASGQATNE
jgi:hypothetical protein